MQVGQDKLLAPTPTPAAKCMRLCVEKKRKLTWIMKISDASLDSDMFGKSGMNIQILTLVMQVRGRGAR